jgi:hypothetical protein
VTFAHAGSRQRSSSECSSAVAWSKSEPFGAEFANVRVDRDRLCADGVAIGSTPVPYRSSAQRYTFVEESTEGRLVRFEAIDADFVADVVFDERGLVVDYPGIARRIPTPTISKDR